MYDDRFLNEVLLLYFMSQLYQIPFIVGIRQDNSHGQLEERAAKCSISKPKAYLLQ